jgi:predicted nucleic acid-binding protein
MRPIILDASVVAKWYIAEEDSEKAVRIRDLHSAGGLRLSEPDLVLYELGNALSKHPAFTEGDLVRALESFLDLGIELVDLAEPGLLRMCFEASKRSRVTFYDAAYAALAKMRGGALLTADEELRDKVGGYCEVQLLRDFSLAEPHP